VSRIKDWSSHVDIATMTTLRVAAVPERTDPATTRERPPAPVTTPRVTPRPIVGRPPAPERSAELAHMSLPRLRAYRRTLMAEELRTSYWRRLLQARRDLCRIGDLHGDLGLLREALTETRRTAGRSAILAVHPEGGLPILPSLPELWACEAGSQVLVGGRDLTTRLSSAESVLSSYRTALIRRLDRATADLVARYHEDPTLCFDALPKAS
jgi:hypothetical protein